MSTSDLIVLGTLAAIFIAVLIVDWVVRKGPMIAEIVAIACMCGGGGATATEQADRLDPPPTTTPDIPLVWTTDAVNGRCVGLEPLLEVFSPGWNVERMSRIMHRESRCQPRASNSCCSGLLQMHHMHIPRMSECGIHTRNDYYDPVKNICAAALLWRTSGYGAWSTS